MQQRTSFIYLLLTFMLLISSTLKAQTLETLFEFGELDSNVSTPFATLVQGTDGDFYGTAVSGEPDETWGAVFKISPDGEMRLLSSFVSTNGAAPIGGLVQGTDGNFYGTTSAGGSNHHGTIFRMTPAGDLTTLAFLNFVNGSQPYAGLVQGVDGDFYGTTKFGGANGLPGGYGTIFKMNADGDITTLVHCNWSTGAYPNSALIQGTNGDFYGTTELGGEGGQGTVFKMSAAGALTTMISFNGTNGYNPVGITQGRDGNLYGVAGPTAFKISPSEEFTTLVSFPSGDLPIFGLTEGADGNFYGTTGGAESMDSERCSR